MFDPLQELEQKLERRADVTYSRLDEQLIIEPLDANGFRVSLSRDHEGWLVGFGDVFHEHFDEPAEAIEFVGFGLSIECRLREVTIPFLRRAIVERRDDSGWAPISEVGVLSSPFPIGRRERTLQNRVIQ